MPTTCNPILQEFFDLFAGAAAKIKDLAVFR